MAQLVDFGLLMQPNYEQTQSEWMNPLREMGSGLASAAKSYAFNKKREDDQAKVQELWDDFNQEENKAYEARKAEQMKIGDMDIEAPQMVADTSTPVEPSIFTDILNRGEPVMDQTLMTPDTGQSMEPLFGQTQATELPTMGLYDARKQIAAKRVSDSKQFAIDKERELDELAGGAEKRAQYERAMTKFRGMDDKAKFNRFAQLVAPYDPELSEKLMTIAEQRRAQADDIKSRREEKLIEQQGKEKSPTTRLENTRVVYGIRRAATQDASDMYKEAPEGKKQDYLDIYNQAVKDEAKAASEFDKAYRDIFPEEKITPNPDSTGGLVTEPAPVSEPTANEIIANNIDIAQNAVNAGTIRSMKTRGELDQFIKKNNITAPAAIDELKKEYRNSPGGIQEANSVEAKRSAEAGWNSIVNDQRYKMADMAIREDASNINSLNNVIAFVKNEKNSVDARRAAMNQAKFQIARAVTGPGIITESELNSTAGINSKGADILERAGFGFLLRGTDLDFDSFMNAASSALTMSNSRIAAPVSSIQDRVTQYNLDHPGFEKPIPTINSYTTRIKETSGASAPKPALKPVGTDPKTGEEIY